jgi:electron transfer DM13
MRSRLLVATGVVGALVLTVGLALFEPWRLFTSSEVDEPAPASQPSVPTESESLAPAPSPAPSSAPSSEPRDEVLSEGAFEDAEHGTSGRASILALADGRRFVRLEGLATSDGPDLHVWLSDQPSGGDWGSYDDGRYVRLGELKATHGNQNYEVPPEAELDGLTSVVIWCDRFNVAFGTAPI